MELTERIEKIKAGIATHLTGLSKLVKEVYQIEGDVQILLKKLEVKVLVYPNDKVFRLKDQRLAGWGHLIKYESDLDKNFEHFIEDISVAKVFFEEGHWNDKEKKAFRVVYQTNGYHEHNNRYTDEDFGKTIFTSKLELVETVQPNFEKAKKDFVAKIAEAKEQKKRNLAAELARLNNEPLDNGSTI